MQLVLLAGELGEKYGKQHEYYNLQTPADAIKLLCINYPALKQELMQAHHNGIGYKVIQGGAAMGYDGLHLPFGSKPLLVVPVISGAGGGSTTQILIGVGLVAASFFLPGAGLFGTSALGSGLLAAGSTAAIPFAGAIGVAGGAFGTAVGTALSAIGASLILSGTANLISPQPSFSARRIRGEGTNVRGPGPDGITRGAMGQANYAFTGPANTAGTGATVPVIYGRVITGSHLIAANLEVSDDSDPLKITTQAPGPDTFRINSEKVSRELKSLSGLKGRIKTNEINGTDAQKNKRILVNKSFGPSGSDKALKVEETLLSEELRSRMAVRKKLDILFKIDKGLFDYVADEGSTIIDGFIRYRITVELTGKDPDPTVATADVTIQGLLTESKKDNIVYGHRLVLPRVPDRNEVRVKVEILDLEVHDGARLIFHAYGYGLLDGDD